MSPRAMALTLLPTPALERIVELLPLADQASLACVNRETCAVTREVGKVSALKKEFDRVLNLAAIGSRQVESLLSTVANGLLWVISGHASRRVDLIAIVDSSQLRSNFPDSTEVDYEKLAYMCAAGGIIGGVSTLLMGTLGYGPLHVYHKNYDQVYFVECRQGFKSNPRTIATDPEMLNCAELLKRLSARSPRIGIY